MVTLAVCRFLAMQSAKARIPSIKFRYGHQAGSQQPVTSSAPAKQTTAPVRAAGAAVTVKETQLPARFLRQEISEEEIEYINRGGPA